MAKQLRILVPIDTPKYETKIQSKKRDKPRPFRSLLKLLGEIPEDESAVNTNMGNNLEDEFKEYLDTRLQHITETITKLEEDTLKRGSRIDKLSEFQFKQTRDIIKIVQRRIDRSNLDTIIDSSKKEISDHINNQVDRRHDELASNLQRYLDKGDLNENRLTECESKVAELEEYISKESHNINSINSGIEEIIIPAISTLYPTTRDKNETLKSKSNLLEDIIHQDSKIKLKTKRSKENKIEIRYDSLNPQRLELSPRPGGKIEITTYARNLDSEDIISKTNLFDPFRLDKSERDLELFIDEMNEHYASGTIDSIVRSLHDPNITKYLDRKTGPRFKRKFEKIKDTFLDRYSGINSEMNSDVARLIIHKNKRLPGYSTLESGRRMIGLSSALTLPFKILPYIGKMID